MPEWAVGVIDRENDTSWPQGRYRQDIDAILASMRNARFSNNDRKRRWRIVLENGRNLFQAGGSLIHIAGIQLDFKCTPRAVVKLDDGVDFPAVIVLVMVKLRVNGFCIYLKVANLSAVLPCAICIGKLRRVLYHRCPSAATMV